MSQTISTCLGDREEIIGGRAPELGAVLVGPEATASLMLSNVTILARPLATLMGRDYLGRSLPPMKGASQSWHSVARALHYPNEQN